MAKPTNSSELKPNPHADLPLPAYAQAWGNSVYRPENLPVNHDIRLDPAHIFAFPQHPETNEAEEYFVVGIRCSQCSRARQLCSRGDPICRRCTEKNLVCRPMGPGWEECPDTRVKKPRLLQEMVALQKSLPDAPYYREHSSAVSKTISSGTNGSLKLRKGRQTWQESATPVRRGRKSEGAVRREEEDTAKTLVESEQTEDKGKDGLEAEPLGGVKSDVAKDGEKDIAIVSSARTDGKLSAIGSNSVTTIVNGLPSSQATAIEDAQPLSPSSTLVVANGGTAFTSGEQSGQVQTSSSSNLQAMVMAFTTRIAHVITRIPSSGSQDELVNGAAPATPVCPSPSKEQPPMGRLSPPPPSIESPAVTRIAPPQTSSRPEETNITMSNQPTSSLSTSDRLASRIQETSKSALSAPQANPDSLVATGQATGPAAPANGQAPTPTAVPTTPNVAAAPAPFKAPLIPAAASATPRVAFTPISAPPHATPMNQPPRTNGGPQASTPTSQADKSLSHTNAVPVASTSSTGVVANKVKTFSIPTVPTLASATAAKSSGTRLSIRVPPRPNLVSSSSSQGSHAITRPPNAISKASAAEPNASTSASANATSQQAPRRTNGSKPNAKTSPPPSKEVQPPASSPAKVPPPPPAATSPSKPADPPSPAEQTALYRLHSTAAWAARLTPLPPPETESSEDERPLMDIHKERHGVNGSGALKRKRSGGDKSERNQRQRRDDCRYPSAKLPGASAMEMEDALPSGFEKQSSRNAFLTPMRKQFNVGVVSRSQRRRRSDEEEDDEDSEEEVLQVLKRPRPSRKAHGKSPQGPTSLTFLPRESMFDDSTVVMVENYLFQLPRSRLIHHSEYFAKLLAKAEDEEEASDDEGLRYYDRCKVLKVSGVSAEDFETLLGVCDNIGPFLENTTPFPLLAAVFCAARTLRFSQIDALATHKLTSMWSSDIHKLSIVSLPYAAETVVLARMYNVPCLLKRAFYELLRLDSFTQKNIEAAANEHEGELIDGSRLIGRAKLSHADLLRLTNAREKIQLAWAIIAGAGPASHRYPCPLQKTVATDTTPEMQALRARCAEAHRNSAAIWAYEVLDSSLFEIWMQDPICGLERLIVLNWEKAGYCPQCALKRKQLWTSYREELWSKLDNWLDL